MTDASVPSVPRRLLVRPSSFVLLGVGAIAVLVIWNVAVAGRRYIAWALACAVVAIIVEPVVSALDRRLPKAIAVILALGLLAGVGTFVAYRAQSELVQQLQDFERTAPTAARNLERSERFGELATDFRLSERVDTLVKAVDSQAKEMSARVFTRGTSYFVCGVLVVFMLIWGPRIAAATLREVPGEKRRANIEMIARTALRTGRNYLLGALPLALAVGGISWAMLKAADAPLPSLLALFIAALSVLPYGGVLIAAVPALVLTAGLHSPGRAGVLAVAFFAIQIAHAIALRRLVVERTFNPGPAVVFIGGLLGLDIYGLGGAIFGTALFILGASAVDAVRKQPAGAAA